MKPICLFNFENNLRDKLFFQTLANDLEYSIHLSDILDEDVWSQYLVICY